MGRNLGREDIPLISTASLKSPATLREYTVKELGEVAKKVGVENWRGLKKEQLVQALVRHAKRREAAKAKKASSNAYIPYSQFAVGAALRTKSGAVFSGCNVENVSYGLTICAERTAVFSMVAAGDGPPEEIVVFTPTDKLTFPCGACRNRSARPAGGGLSLH